jgi:hypothetical protein
MQPAFAAATSYAVSYVAMVLECETGYYQVKWEVGGGWSAGGALPCGSMDVDWPGEYGAIAAFPPGGSLPEPTSTPIDGDKVKWTFDFTGIGCAVVWSLNKCGQLCEVNSATGPVVTFSPCVADPSMATSSDTSVSNEADSLSPADDASVVDEGSTTETTAPADAPTESEITEGGADG